jgi:hypothetical protein
MGAGRGSAALRCRVVIAAYSLTRKRIGRRLQRVRPKFRNGLGLADTCLRRNLTVDVRIGQGLKTTQSGSSKIPREIASGRVRCPRLSPLNQSKPLCSSTSCGKPVAANLIACGEWFGGYCAS